MTPAEHKEKQLTVAKKARGYLDSLAPIKDVETRAAIMHDKIGEEIRAICADRQGTFNLKQVDALAAIAVHLAIVMDPSLKEGNGLWPKLRAEFRGLSAVAKTGAYAALISLAVGLIQLSIWGVNGALAGWRWYAEKEASAAPANEHYTNNTPVREPVGPLPLQKP